MKKKIVSTLLCASMAATMLAGCGGSTSDTSKSDGGDASVSSNDGKVLNIYCWNEEFKSRITDHYPDYEEVDSTHGKIGDVDVVWNITPNDDNAYQNNLDATLVKQNDASADDKIDLFLIEADYALKYVDSDYTVPIKDLGIADSDTSKQYQYTKDIVSDDGKLKGTTWQATPGLFAYRRSIAKQVLGTDDPDEVQKKLGTWSDFDNVAAQMHDAGYYMLSGYDDSYRTFSNNVSGKWVQDGKIVIDPSIQKWIDQTKDYSEKGYNNRTTLWSPQWSGDQGPDGNVFGFFYSTWGINFTLMGNSLADPNAPAKAENGIYGDYAVCEGPQAYYWGGTWICAAKGTDNVPFIHDLMYRLTCEADTMKQITLDTQDYTNNQTAMEEIAGSDYSSDFLGGQNHIALFAEAAKKIDMSNICDYDKDCNEQILKAFHPYFEGDISYGEAMEDFYNRMIELDQELRR